MPIVRLHLLPFYSMDLSDREFDTVPRLGLHSAASTGNVGLVEYALEHGQPINSVLDGVLPLHAACAGGNVQVVKLLIEHGADVNAPRLPRRYSNDRNRDSSAPIVGTSGSTPLHFAAANGNTAVVNLLLLHGAHADRADKHGVTPELLARQSGWVECAELLKQWLINKDRDLRERPGGTIPPESLPGTFRDRIGSFGSDTESRRRLHVKHSIDNALNKLKSSATDIRLHSPSSQLTSTPPASPVKPLGEYTFVSISPSEEDSFEVGPRRPSLPHILQPSSMGSYRSRKTSTPNSTNSPSPRRPRSAGNGAEGQEPDATGTAQPKQPVVRKLGSKYSLMNLFKKAQPGAADQVIATDLSQSLVASVGPSNATSSPSPLSQTLASSEAVASTPSGFRIHRGSDASPRTTPQQSGTPQSLQRKTSGTISLSPRPLAIDLHNQLVEDRDRRQRQSRDRSRSTGSGARFPPDDNVSQSPSPRSSPLLRLGLRSQSDRRNRSGSGSSLGTSSTPGYRGGAVFDDDIIVVSGESSSARPSILKAHSRTSSSGYTPGTPSGFRTLRFDSSSSITARMEGDDEPLMTSHVLRGSSSTGSLGRRHLDYLGRGFAPGMRVSEENLSPDSAPATLTDFSRPRNKDTLDGDDDDEEEYGQTLQDYDSPVIDPGELKPGLLLRERGRPSASSSESSLSPIMPNDQDSSIINTEFPFSINSPPVPVMEPEEIESVPPAHSLLNVPSMSDHRSRGDSLSSTSTADSSHPQLSASGTTSGSETVTTPWLSSPGRDHFPDVVHLSPPHEHEIVHETVENIEFLDAPPNTNKATVSTFNDRRSHVPPDINIDAISAHAHAEALVQKAQQDILEMVNSSELTPASGSTGRSPLSAKLAAYGESLALERKLREQKEQEERRALDEERMKRQRSVTEPSIRSSTTTPTDSNFRRTPFSGVERQRSLEHRPNKSRLKSRGKDSKRPSTAEGLASRSLDQAASFHQSSQSESGILLSPPSRLLPVEPESPIDGDDQATPSVSQNSTSLSVSTPRRAPSPAPPILRSRTPVPPSRGGQLSRTSSLDGTDTDTDLGPALHRVSTAPHAVVRGTAKTTTKLAKMGFPPLEQARAPATNKRFGAISKLFTSPELSNSPGNHCVPLLDVIPPKEGSNTTFIVTPLLYPINIAPFETIGEIIDFFRQLFEGLQFMHNHNAVHGDCKSDNIMADFGGSYDHPPHPMNWFRKRDFSGRPSPPISRTIKPIKYYFIDFDLSQIYGREDARLRTPPWGGIRSVPEHLIPNDPPCDPFAVDVYCIAHVIKEDFLDGNKDYFQAPKQRLDFMRELVSDMTIDDPKKKPTMDQVVARFDKIVEGLSEWTLRSPVVDVGQSYGLFASISHWVKQLVYVVRGIPAIPRAQ
ncbi:hypothetical protein H0H93_011119 [Arthromyces matolae]|nr:hypothetical protein H0H93_011119 [Arthromyces matolae]